MRDRSMRQWVKDIAIQTVFIIIAVCFTVLIASASMRGQYTEYYESTLEDKASALALGAAMVLSERHDYADSGSIQAALDILFSAGAGPENIYYALYDNGRLIAANTSDAASNLSAVEQNDRVGDTLVRVFRPVDPQERYVIAISVDYAPFLAFGRDLEDALYPAMFRGCALMAAAFALFTFLSNLRKPKKEPMPEEQQTVRGFYSLLRTQFIAMSVFLLLSLPFLYIYLQNRTIIRIGALIIGGFFLALAAAHLFRLLMWLLLWYFKRPISSYSAQTLQFLMFLIIFLTQFTFAVQNGYQAQIELSRQDELRISTMFIALTYGQELQIDAPILDENNEYFIVTRTEEGFRAAGMGMGDISNLRDLLETAWDARSSAAGVRGGYLYGVSAVADSLNGVTALVCARQPYSLFREELTARNADFLLGMSATVLALVFLFIELNKLLEAINRPLQKKERGLKYAFGARGLVFLVTMSQYIPQYFFVLIVFGIYSNNPVSWLPAGTAVMFPLFLAMPIMLFGKTIADKFIKLDARASMTLGCVVGAAGFLLMGAAGNLFVFLLIMAFTYTGISIVYNGLWDYVIYTSGFDYPELQSIKQNTVGGEFLGYTSGAVLGAMVYDKFGLFAALSTAAGILLLLGVLLRCMKSITSELDADEVANEEKEGLEEPEGVKYTFIRFLTSKNIIRYYICLILPFVVAPLFINHFSPLYAESINLSPGAVSWTSLLQVIFIAYVSPRIGGYLARRLSSATVVTVANTISAAALILFALLPGLTALYAASALIGIAAGVGTTAMAAGYYGLPEAQSYGKSRYVYFALRSIGGQIGTILFTLVYAGSVNGELVLAIALPIAVLSLGYAFYSKKARSS